MKQIPLFPHLFQDPTQKLTVERKRKTTRSGESYRYSTLTRAEIKAQYPRWDGENYLLRADYRLGLVVTITELKPDFSK
jgi:hypothetical protein